MLKKVAICGGSGYTGVELLRILSCHPLIEISAVTSEKSAGKKVCEVFPHFHNLNNLVFESLNNENLLRKADIFFLALPHGSSQKTVNFFYSNNKKVVDLSADYRLVDTKEYEEWYGLPHNYKKTLNKAVYGLPEIYRDKIKKANLIANPGCYPTGAILGLLPAVKKKLINLLSIVIDSKSGTSGAGRKADISSLYCEVNEDFKAYSVATHRHTPEIEQELSFLAGKKITVNFTPHLLPVDRGILSTIYAKLICKADTKSLLNLYRKLYKDEPFVRILDKDNFPKLKNVRGTNFCEIGIEVNSRTNTLIVVTAIDNLVKGASGQAVHNMNLMMGFKETTGLESLALYP